MPEITAEPIYQLQKYFEEYLLNIRKVSPSTVKHYYNSIRTISRYLKEKNLIKESLYEITSITELKILRTALMEDSEFVALNKRGNQMYTAGLNRYLEFANGNNFTHCLDITKLDMIVSPPEPLKIVREDWKRSNILRKQALEYANYQCEINNNHETFLTDSENLPYMEGHHAMPMQLQSNFAVSLDVYANIVCLCPTCHRKIHFGHMEDRIAMIKGIYDQRQDRLRSSGIVLSKDEFVDKIIGN